MVSLGDLLDVNFQDPPLVMNKKKRGVREKSYRALHLDDPEKKNRRRNELVLAKNSRIKVGSTHPDGRAILKGSTKTKCFARFEQTLAEVEWLL